MSKKKIKKSIFNFLVPALMPAYCEKSLFGKIAFMWIEENREIEECNHEWITFIFKEWKMYAFYVCLKKKKNVRLKMKVILQLPIYLYKTTILQNIVLGVTPYYCYYCST